jgi:hypothetical protein
MNENFGHIKCLVFPTYPAIFSIKLYSRSINKIFLSTSMQIRFTARQIYLLFNEIPQKLKSKQNLFRAFFALFPTLVSFSRSLKEKPFPTN